MSALTGPLLKVVVSLLFLVLAFWVTDFSAVSAYLSGKQSGQASYDLTTLAWLALAIVMTLPQYLLSARRWQITAMELGLELNFRNAVRAYYKATFFNQILPGGVLGDVGRALDHGQSTLPDRRTNAWNAVIIERSVGQFVLIVLTAIVSLVATTVPLAPSLIALLFATLFAGALVLGVRSGAMKRFNSRAARLLQAGFDDLASIASKPRLILAQALLSIAVLCAYALCFVALAIALDFDFSTDADFMWLLSVVLLLLLSMSLPISMAGWGVRESSAAGLWMAAGLDPAQGVAIAVAYGLLNLFCSLPGLLLVLTGATGRSSRSKSVS